MPAITFNLTSAESIRVTNTALAQGYPDAKSMVIALISAAVADRERTKYINAFVPPAPISPT